MWKVVRSDDVVAQVQRNLQQLPTAGLTALTPTPRRSRARPVRPMLRSDPSRAPSCSRVPCRRQLRIVVLSFFREDGGLAPRSVHAHVASPRLANFEIFNARGTKDSCWPACLHYAFFIRSRLTRRFNGEQAQIHRRTSAALTSLQRCAAGSLASRADTARRLHLD